MRAEVRNGWLKGGQAPAGSLQAGCRPGSRRLPQGRCSFKLASGRLQAGFKAASSRVQGRGMPGSRLLQVGFKLGACRVQAGFKLAQGGRKAHPAAGQAPWAQTQAEHPGQSGVPCLATRAPCPLHPGLCPCLLPRTPAPLGGFPFKDKMRRMPGTALACISLRIRETRSRGLRSPRATGQKSISGGKSIR